MLLKPGDEEGARFNPEHGAVVIGVGSGFLAVVCTDVNQGSAWRNLLKQGITHGLLRCVQWPLGSVPRQRMAL